MTTPAEATRNEQEWPGVAPAQAFVIPSYQWMVARFEAADSRLQTLLTFVATVTFAIPTVSRALRPDISLGSRWFVTALVLAAVITVVGVVARLSGVLTLASPKVIYQQSLGLTEWEFQRDALHFAGEHYEKNRRAVNRKAAAAAVMAVLFVGELASFFIWGELRLTSWGLVRVRTCVPGSRSGGGGGGALGFVVSSSAMIYPPVVQWMVQSHRARDGS